jgi:hypothetical protein
MPGARCARKRVCNGSGRAHTRSSGHTGITRHSPRNGLRLISRSPRRPGFFATVARRVAPANLTPASGCQDHTISPSAFGALVRSATRVHRIPPRVDDDGQRPSVGRDGLEYRGDLYSGKQKYFCKQDWTGQITLKSKADFFSGSMPDSRPMTAPCELQHVRHVIGSGAATGRVLHRWRCVMRKLGDFENLPSFQHHA